jgi:hypothetical protein
MALSIAQLTFQFLYGAIKNAVDIVFANTCLLVIRA